MSTAGSLDFSTATAATWQFICLALRGAVTNDTLVIRSYKDTERETLGKVFDSVKRLIVIVKKKYIFFALLSSNGTGTQI